MVNGSQQTPLIKEEIPPQAKKSNNRLWIALGTIIIVFTIAILWKAYVISKMDKTATEKAQIEFVLDTFMKSMSARDIESAYALFSPRAQQQDAISRLQEMRESYGWHSLFAGYQSLSVRKLDFASAANPNPDIPQGADVIAEGDISYEGGYTGTFRFAMEKVGDVWCILDVSAIFAQSH